MRSRSLDICRAVCCLTVVFGHTMMFFWDFNPASPSWAIHNFISTFARHTLCLFFMISGALLLSRKTLNLKKHFKRIGNYIILMFAWGFIFAFLDNKFWHVWYIDASFIQLVFGGYYHLWYLSALVQCSLFLPVLHGAIHKTGLNMKYCFGLVLYSVILVNISYLPDKPYWLEMLLILFNPTYIKYLVYFFLGWWLFEHELNSSQLTVLAVLSFAAVFLYSWLNRRYSISMGVASSLFCDFLSPAMVLLSSFAFCMFKKIKTVPNFLNPVLNELLACSFGIYLIHPPLVSLLKSMHLGAAQISFFILAPIIFIFFLGFSMICAMILRRIPGLRYLVS